HQTRPTPTPLTSASHRAPAGRRRVARLACLVAAAGLPAPASPPALGWAAAWRFPHQQRQQPAAGQREADTRDQNADPEVDRIIEALERAANRDADTRIAPPPTTPAAASSKLLREGTFLRSRRGRVVRDEAGDWVFRFDSDGQSPITDPPMVLMPCQAL